MNLLVLNFDRTAFYVFCLFYIVLTIYTMGKILLDTSATSKTLAYLLLVIVLPVFGIIFYYAFGINTRRGKSNKAMGLTYTKISKEFESFYSNETKSLLLKNKEQLAQYSELVLFLKNIGNEDLTLNNYQLLLNGEEKFPELLKALNNAEDYIHLEYYAWENDRRGNQIKDVLLKKAKEGVKVRALYDAYASRKIKHNIVKELIAGGVAIYPILKVILVGFANRINHRDHRKIVIVDGNVGFIGGINLSDRYDNSIDTGLYWRDTHLKITGPGVMKLQRHFMVSWNFCQSEQLTLRDVVAAKDKMAYEIDRIGLSQVIAGGPIYNMSNIMLSYARLFTLVREKLYITNPYFVPNETILDALKQAAKSGVDVRLLLPKKTDSLIVGAASKYYFKELLLAGVKIFQYNKGFVHAKTVMADNRVSVIGTANMDIRSFDLNFEIMQIVYDYNLALQLEKTFINDLNSSEQIDCDVWLNQGKAKMLFYALARLTSSFL